MKILFTLVMGAALVPSVFAEGLPALPSLDEVKTQLANQADTKYVPFPREQMYTKSTKPREEYKTKSMTDPYAITIKLDMDITGDAVTFEASDLFESVSLDGKKKSATDAEFTVTVESDFTLVRTRSYKKGDKTGYMVMGDDMNISVRSFGPDFTLMGSIEQGDDSVIGSDNFNLIIKKEGAKLSIAENGLLIEVDGKKITAEFDRKLVSRRVVGVLAGMMVTVLRDLAAPAAAALPSKGGFGTMKDLRMPLMTVTPDEDETAKLQARDMFENLEITVAKLDNGDFRGEVYDDGGILSFNAKVDSKRKIVMLNSFDVNLTMRLFGPDYRIYGRADGKDIDLTVKKEGGKLIVEAPIFTTIEASDTEITGRFDEQQIPMKGFGVVSALLMMIQMGL